MQLLISFMLLLSVNGAAQESTTEPLTMSDAVRLALAYHPSVAAAHNRVSAAQFRLRSAASIPNPELTLSPFIGPDTVSGSDDQITLAQKIEISGRGRLRSKIASAHLTGARADSEKSRRDLVLAVKSAYVDLQLAKDVVTLNESLVATAKLFREAAQRQFDVGNVPRVQIDRAEIELARAEQELLRSKSNEHVRTADLNILIGRDIDRPIAMAETLQFQPETIISDDVMRHAIEHRPELLSASAELRARKTIVSQHASERIPDLVVEGKRNRFDATGDNAMRLVVVFPLFDLGSIRNDVRAARSDVHEQEAILEKMKAEIRLQVTSTLAGVQRAQALAERYQQEIVPRTERLTQTIERGFNAGASTSLDVLDAHRTLRSVQTEYRQAIADYLKAIAELEWAAG